MTLQINRQRNDATALIRLEGEVDIATVDELDLAIGEAVDGDAPTLVLDVSALSFMDSTGLRSVLTAHEQMQQRDGNMILVVGRGPVSRLIDVTGLAGTLDVRQDSSFLESS